MNREVAAVAVLAAVLVVVWPPARRVAWLALRGLTGAVLALLALAVERRRQARPEPAAAQLPPVPHRWRVDVFIAHGGRTVRLAAGVVVGPWTTPADVEGEALARWISRHGWPATGRLCCRATPAEITHKSELRP